MRIVSGPLLLAGQKRGAQKGRAGKGQRVADHEIGQDVVPAVAEPVEIVAGAVQMAGFAGRVQGGVPLAARPARGFRMRSLNPYLSSMALIRRYSRWRDTPSAMAKKATTSQHTPHQHKTAPPDTSPEAHCAAPAPFNTKAANNAPTPVMYGHGAAFT